MTPKTHEFPNTNEQSPLLMSNDIVGVVALDELQELSLWTRIKYEINEQMTILLPTLPSMILRRMPWLISLGFVGGIGAEELAAAALATTLFNVTGISLSVGLTSALSTLAGQAKGELVSRNIEAERRRRQLNFEDDSSKKNRNERLNNNDTSSCGKTKWEPITPLVYLYRGLVVQFVIVIPIAIWWLFGIKNLLLSLGQTELLSSMTEVYLQVLSPGLVGYSLDWTLTTWVQAIGMADVPVYSSIVGVGLHIPMNWFFIYYIDLGYLGCALATICNQFIQPVLMFLYLFGWQHGRKRVLQSTGGLSIGRTGLSFWKEFFIATSSVRGYIQYMGLALPAIVAITEWWASETAVFLAGRLQPTPEAAVGGMTIYQSINSFCYMFPVACSIAATTRVGNLLGAGEPFGAAFAAKVSVVGAFCLSFALGSLLYCMPHTFLPSLFAPDEDEIILETSRTLPMLSIYVVADGIVCTLNGIIKGCGRQCITMPIVLVAYWVVAIPLAYYLAFVRHHREMICDDSYFCGDTGLVAGMTIGTWVHMFLMAVVVVGTINWEVEAKNAKERVGSDE